MKSKVVAVIDLGSNSIRMTVAKIKENGKIKELGNYRRPVRISAGLKETGKIDLPAFTRTVHALQEFCECMHSFCVEEVVAVATEALRKAKNSAEFVENVKATTSICFQIISGEEEARYDFLGVSEGRPVQDCILQDTGGGSTEFMQIVDGRLKNVISLPLGGVVLTEGFLKNDPPTQEEMAALHGYVQQQIQQKAPWLSNCKHWPVFAIGGTNRAMMKLLKKKEFAPEELQQLYKTLQAAPLETRKQFLGEFQDRADIVVGGLAPLMCVIKELAPKSIIVSQKGLRDGILYEMAQNAGKQVDG